MVDVPPMTHHSLQDLIKAKPKHHEAPYAGHPFYPSSPSQVLAEFASNFRALRFYPLRRRKPVILFSHE
jgi:hypothetical protein